MGIVTVTGVLGDMWEGHTCDRVPHRDHKPLVAGINVDAIYESAQGSKRSLRMSCSVR